MIHDSIRGNDILDLVLSTERDIISFCEVVEKIGKNDHNISRFTVHFRYDFKDNNMTIQNLNFRLANFDKIH